MNFFDDDTQYLKDHEVSRFTRRALGTLRNDRHFQRGIPYVKYRGSVFYDLKEIGCVIPLLVVWFCLPATTVMFHNCRNSACRSG